MTRAAIARLFVLRLKVSSEHRSHAQHLKQVRGDRAHIQVPRLKQIIRDVERVTRALLDVRSIGVNLRIHALEEQRAR